MMDRAAPDRPPPEEEGIHWLPPAPAEIRGEGDWAVYGPCTIDPGYRSRPITLVIEEGDASIDFSREITPAPKRTRRGDPLLSVMAGTLSILIGIVISSALMGLGPQSIPGLVKRATIMVGAFNGYGGRPTPGSWFVPEGGFFVLAFFALTLSGIGIVLSRGRGRPVMSLIGFGLNTVAFVAGFLLAFTDYSK